MAATSEHYTPTYFDELTEGSRRSARAVLPHVLSRVPVTSALDVGCGVGTWAGALGELGVDDVVGLDGDYVDRDRLHIPPERFVAADLAAPVDLGRSFDLAMSLEVAEHLPEDRALVFLDTLVRHADVVLFSAAIPSQGGEDHVNEQWPEYWAELFAAFDYEAVDCLRPLIWRDPAVRPWYAQNVMLFVERDRLADLPALEPTGVPMSLVHPMIFDIYRPWTPGPAADPFAG